MPFGVVDLMVWSTERRAAGVGTILAVAAIVVVAGSVGYIALTSPGGPLAPSNALPSGTVTSTVGTETPLVSASTATVSSTSASCIVKTLLDLFAPLSGDRSLAAILWIISAETRTTSYNPFF
jgi:hypothetical protein